MATFETGFSVQEMFVENTPHGKVPLTLVEDTRSSLAVDNVGLFHSQIM